MEKRIVHCDLHTFFVSVERLQNSKLIGVPVFIGGSNDRRVVASCSNGARKFGTARPNILDIDYVFVNVPECYLSRSVFIESDKVH